MSFLDASRPVFLWVSIMVYIRPRSSLVSQTRCLYRPIWRAIEVRVCCHPLLYLSWSWVQVGRGEMSQRVVVRAGDESGYEIEMKENEGNLDRMGSMLSEVSRGGLYTKRTASGLYLYCWSLPADVSLFLFFVFCDFMNGVWDWYLHDVIKTQPYWNMVESRHGRTKLNATSKRPDTTIETHLPCL